MEDRNLFNVSSIFDAQGHFAEAIVDNLGKLTLYDQTGPHSVDSNVRVAHLFRNAHGKVGMDVVLKTGTAYSKDSTGTFPISGTNIIDASRVVGTNGNFVLDVVFANSVSTTYGPDLTGTLVETTKTGSKQIGTNNVRWATVYVDAKGQVGHASGLIIAGNLVASRTDSTGTYQLYNAPDGATQDITDYFQTRDKRGRVLVDITFGRFAGTYALQFSNSSVVAIGSGSDIAVGG